MRTSTLIVISGVIVALCSTAFATGAGELWGPADEGDWQLIDLSGGHQQDEYSYLAPDGTCVVSNVPHRKYADYYYHTYLVDHSYYRPPFNDTGEFLLNEGRRVDVNFIFPEPRRVDKVVVYPNMGWNIISDYALAYSADGKSFVEVVPRFHAEFGDSEYDDYLGTDVPKLTSVSHNTRGLVAKAFRITIFNRGKPGGWYGLNEVEFYQLAQAPNTGAAEQVPVGIDIIYCPDHVPAGERFPVIFELSRAVQKVTPSCTDNAVFVGEELVNLPAGLHKCFFQVKAGVEGGEVAVALTAAGQKARYGGITPIPREL